MILFLLCKSTYFIHTKVRTFIYIKYVFNTALNTYFLCYLFGFFFSRFFLLFLFYFLCYKLYFQVSFFLFLLYLPDGR